MTRELTIYKCILALILITSLAVLAGCESVIEVLDKVDAACVDLTLDGHTTDSGMQGRGIILPEGKELDQETIEALCEY